MMRTRTLFSAVLALALLAGALQAQKDKAHRGKKHGAGTRAKMSEAHRQRGTRPPKAGRPWTAEEVALLRELPPAEVARRTGRTLKAVYSWRRVLGMPDGRSRRAGP